MPITTQVMGSGEHCVTWVSKFERAKKKANEIFQLDHFPEYISYFSLVYDFEDIKSGEEKYQAEFVLTQSAYDSSRERSAISDYYYEPSAVWMNNSEGQKLMFQKFPRHNGWKITTAFRHSRFTVNIFIKFNSFREINVLLKQLTDIYANQSNCDIQFLFQDDQKIGGHISILAARSPVLAAMFNNQPTKTDPVFINDTQPGIFRELLHFIYSGRTKVPLTEANVWSLFTAAEKYDVAGLKEECTRFLLIQIRASNAIDWLVLADFHSMKSVKEAAVKIITANFKTIFPTHEWEEFAKTYPDLCLPITLATIGQINS
ncbi:hypothetical protein DAPPUDRAFT_96372 [Daphnia pulex]|uniref:BTB domain-containing protein n=1 Tax=Daphnia pulex TaxID=6669 RepID=E9FXQ4_DAPPU|nr:hypothetical protein DAPPUDRAFT_96372 [Daphnia pulex]|eukprot:EFX88134.1 hypothetical protein DAPPUDRAFT_96372 [Daphnia pulex]